KNDSPLSWNAEKYIRQIKNISQIKDHACNPILLKITLTVLPGLLGKTKTSQINRMDLYDEFIMKWFERAQDRLKEEGAAFLENTNEKCRLALFSMPLIRRGNQYWFFHKSLRDHLIACALLDSSKDMSQATLFNKQSIIPGPQFLIERVKHRA
ncbi:4718_t:CDS:2, partial [Dentiscutata heterogama]